METTAHCAPMGSGAACLLCWQFGGNVDSCTGGGGPLY